MPSRIRALAGFGRRLLQRRVPWHVLRRGAALGSCPICERRTLFYAEGDWLRDQYRCIRCASIPRWRALMQVLHTQFPDWRTRRIHESSPGGPASEKIARECRQYTPTRWPAGPPPPGSVVDGVRCEDLEALTFADRSFDLVITQDVLEHVLDPGRAFAEIARTLVPGGAHVFTVPWYSRRATLVRAVRDGGEVRMLEEPEYHRDPVDPDGALVVTEWGRDLCEFIRRHSGMTTSVVSLHDRALGIVGEYREVFVSRKPVV